MLGAAHGLTEVPAHVRRQLALRLTAGEYQLRQWGISLFLLPLSCEMALNTSAALFEALPYLRLSSLAQCSVFIFSPPVW